jgi:hypothetical protein
MSRHAPVVLFFCLPVSLAAAAACTSADSNNEAQSSDIVGGSPSSRAEVVVVADASDHYACAGVLVHPSVVLVPFGCPAAAVYLGFSANIDASTVLGSVAGGATRIGLDGVAHGEVASSEVIRLQSPAPSSATIASVNPAVGASCEVVGYGRDANGALVGKQRKADVSITSVSIGGSTVDAKGVTGSIALDDFDGFLFCGGELIGPKEYIEVQAPDPINNETTFASFASPVNRTQLTRLLGGATDAGAPADANADAAPPPKPGDPCPTVNAIAQRTCGNCGIEMALCLAPQDGGTPVWGNYGVCTNEGFCAPGSVDTTPAGCAVGVRTRTCENSCAWGPWSLVCN